MINEEVPVVEAPAAVVPTAEPKVKRRYVKITPGEFVRVCNESETRQEVVKKTGMTLSGVNAKIKTLRARKYGFKKFEDGRKARFAKKK